MISLPPGCTVNYEVMITLKDLSTEFLQWWDEIGGLVQFVSYYDHRGREQRKALIQYSGARPSHTFNDGSGQTLVRFRSEDAHVALMLLLKWPELIIGHNMKEVEKYVY